MQTSPSRPLSPALSVAALLFVLLLVWGAMTNWTSDVVRAGYRFSTLVLVVVILVAWEKRYVGKREVAAPALGRLIVVMFWISRTAVAGWFLTWGLLLWELAPRFVLSIRPLAVLWILFFGMPAVAWGAAILGPRIAKA